MPDLSVLAHNIHAGAGGDGRKKAHAFLNLMDDHDAQVGVVTEAKTAVRTLERCGLTVLAEKPLPRDNDKPLPEQGDTVIVVDGKQIRRTWVAVQKLRWVVRKYNRWHDPRRDQVAMLKGKVRGVRAVHLPPGGPHSPVNGAAWRAQMDDALRWVSRRGCRVVVGDLNASSEVVAAYIDRNGHKNITIEGRGVDLILVANGGVRHTNLGDQGDGYDHKAGLYHITANR